MSVRTLYEYMVAVVLTLSKYIMAPHNSTLQLKCPEIVAGAKNAALVLKCIYLHAPCTIQTSCKLSLLSSYRTLKRAVFNCCSRKIVICAWLSLYHTDITTLATASVLRPLAFIHSYEAHVPSLKFCFSVCFWGVLCGNHTKFRQQVYISSTWLCTSFP